MVKAEILAIGDELCYGRVYDTNSFWLADQVTRLGVIVSRITCIRDDPDAICAVLTDAVRKHPRFVFMTGGLGPTDDDRTIEALAKFTGRRVVVDETVLQVIAKRRNVPASQLQPRHVKMASTVEGAECRPSPLGSAPLTIIRKDDVTLFTLPGPPNEVKACFTTYIAHDVQNTTHRHSLAKRLRVTMHESQLAPIIRQIVNAIPEVYIKPLISEYTADDGIAIEVIVFGDDETTCHRTYRQVLHRFEELVEQEGQRLIEIAS